MPSWSWLVSVQKDLRWRLEDPTSLAMWIGIPLLLGGLMGLVFGGGGIQGKGTLLVVDADDTIVTKAIAQVAGGAGPIQVQKVGAATGRERIDAGDASGLLVIPKGFSDALLDDSPTSLSLTLNPSEQVFPKMIQGGAELLVDGEFYLQRLAGDLVKDLAKMQPKGSSSIVDSLLVGAFAVRVNNRLKSFENVLIPPVLSVEDELTGSQKAAAGDTKDGGAATAKKKPTPSFGMLLFPGILFMSLMFMAQGMSNEIWREKDQGTLARFLCTPSGATTFLAAKAISGGLTMGAVATVGLLVGYASFGIPADVIPMALAWIVFSGTAILVLFFVIQMLAKSATGGTVLSSVVVFPLMMIGGSFMPFESMPRAMHMIGSKTPNGVAVQQLKQVIESSYTWGELGQSVLWLGLMGGGLFGLAQWQMRSRFLAA